MPQNSLSCEAFQQFYNVIYNIVFITHKHHYLMSKVLFTLTAFACLMFMSFSTLNNNDGDDSTTKDNKLKIHWISFEEAVKE